MSPRVPLLLGNQRLPNGHGFILARYAETIFTKLRRIRLLMKTLPFELAVFTTVTDVKAHGTGGSLNTSYTPRHFSAVTRQHDRNKGQEKKSGAAERTCVGRGREREGAGGEGGEDA